MPRKPAPEAALFVRLPAAAAEKLDRAAETLGMRKKDLVAGLVSKYVHLESTGRGAMEPYTGSKPLVDSGAQTPTQGSYSFKSYEPPEVMNAQQAADFLQVKEALILEMAAAGRLPARKLGDSWRFSRTALVAWLSTPEKR